jgi:hypothetical protein
MLAMGAGKEGLFGEPEQGRKKNPLQTRLYKRFSNADN